MSSGPVGRYIRARATLLMMVVAVVAGGAGVPKGHIVSARVAVIQVVVPLVAIGWIVARSSSGRRWDATRRRVS